MKVKIREFSCSLRCSPMHISRVADSSVFTYRKWQLQTRVFATESAFQFSEIEMNQVNQIKLFLYNSVYSCVLSLLTVKFASKQRLISFASKKSVQWHLFSIISTETSRITTLQ